MQQPRDFSYKYYPAVHCCNFNITVTCVLGHTCCVFLGECRELQVQLRICASNAREIGIAVPSISGLPFLQSTVESFPAIIAHTDILLWQMRRFGYENDCRDDVTGQVG